MFMYATFKLMRKQKPAIALVLGIMIIVAVVSLSTVTLTRTVSESNLAKRRTANVQAFWLAEAAINRGLSELRNDFNWTGCSDGGNSCGANYDIDVEVTDSVTRTVTATSTVALGSSEISRSIEAVMAQDIPPDFFDYPLYTAGDVDINGNSFVINADDGDGTTTDTAIVYAGDYDVNAGGTIIADDDETQDISITPLARFDFEELYNISDGQGNVYDEDRLDDESLPGDFWYTTADDGVDNDGDGTTDEEDEWIPNVVYITTDLQLNGNIGTVGGFLVVVGDVITDPDDAEDMVLNGNGTIDGVVYTRGTFRVNGGGGADLNINGGVWSGEEIRINGGVNVAYNSDYMAALGAMDLSAALQVTEWTDSQKPYIVVE